MAEKKLSLKLLVDKENNRLVYAESESDFVDVLLSFLMLPMGTIIRLAGKESNIGCMNALYKCVETLDKSYLNTDACKAMLLSPRMARESEYVCTNLALRIDDDSMHGVYYKCPTWTCSIETHRLVSMFKNVKCLCGKKMSAALTYLKINRPDEVFLKETRRRFMIGRNLNLTLASTTNSLASICELGIRYTKSVEERNISVGRKEVLHLLERSLVSKTPMEDVFLPKQQVSINPMPMVRVNLELQIGPNAPVNCAQSDLTCLDSDHIINPTSMVPVNLERQIGPNVAVNFAQSDPISSDSDHIITLRLLLLKSKKKVLYAEAEEDFVDLLLSFLTLPLGGIIKLVGGSSGVGNAYNLYRSIQPLCDENAVSEERKNLLLKPQVAFSYGIDNQLLQIGEASPWQIMFDNCESCYKVHTDCSHGLGEISTEFINPKLLNTTTERGGGYLKGPLKFMVTDDLLVKPFSSVSSISLLSDLGIPFNDLEEEVVTVGKHEALSLLKASLNSKMVLSQVFCSKKRRFGMD